METEKEPAMKTRKVIRLGRGTAHMHPQFCSLRQAQRQGMERERLRRHRDITD